jgi:hypothetical protein
LLVCLLGSCESKDNKYSRLTIDNYSRRLSSIIENVVQSREEEGSQSQLTLNNFYSRYTSKIEEFSDELNFETITPKYTIYRDELLIIAKNINSYLINRKNAILHLTEASSSFQSAIESQADYEEYLNEMKTDYYSLDLYRNLAYENLQDKLKESLSFIENKFDYLKDVDNMDSIYYLLDSITIQYNNKIEESKLEEIIKMPLMFRDTVNDWLINNRSDFKKLEID